MAMLATGPSQDDSPWPAPTTCARSRPRPPRSRLSTPGSTTRLRSGRSPTSSSNRPPSFRSRGPDGTLLRAGRCDQDLSLSTEDPPHFDLPLCTLFVYLYGMETIPLGELNHHPSKVTARVRAGETLVVTEHGKPVIRMSPAEEPTSALDQLMATGQVRRAVNPGALPELISDLAELPSLADALIAERDRERTR